MNAKRDDGETPLHRAAVKGHKEVVELLIAKGADVNAKDNLGTLRYAASGGRKEVVEVLIAAGTDVNAKDRHGKTPLDHAIRRKRTEAIDLLRKHGDKTAEELKAEGKLEQANNRDRSD